MQFVIGKFTDCPTSFSCSAHLSHSQFTFHQMSFFRLPIGCSIVHPTWFIHLLLSSPSSSSFGLILHLLRSGACFYASICLRSTRTTEADWIWYQIFCTCDHRYTIIVFCSAPYCLFLPFSMWNLFCHPRMNNVYPRIRGYCCHTKVRWNSISIINIFHVLSYSLINYWLFRNHIRCYFTNRTVLVGTSVGLLLIDSA